MCLCVYISHSLLFWYFIFLFVIYHTPEINYFALLCMNEMLIIAKHPEQHTIFRWVILFYSLSQCLCSSFVAVVVICVFFSYTHFFSYISFGSFIISCVARVWVALFASRTFHAQKLVQTDTTRKWFFIQNVWRFVLLFLLFFFFLLWIQSGVRVRLD